MPSIVNTSQVDLAEPTGAAGSVNVTDTSGGVKLAAPVVLVNQAGEAVEFLTDTELRATPLSVTVTNPSGGITGYATEATLQVIAAKPNAPSVVGLDAPTLAALETITANTGGLTDTQLRASALPISGTVTANTGLVQPLTDTQLRATSLNVTVSNQPSTQTINGQVSLDSATLAALENVNATTGGLTNTELRANALPVSGTVELGNTAINALNAVRDATDGMAFSVLTDEQLRQTPLNVESATLNDVLTSINSLNDTMLYFVTAMLDKMPLLTSQDRAMVEVLNTITANIGSNQTLTTVTNVSNLNNFAGGNTALIPYQIGASYIYPNIIVS